jgi:hypothetical protein
MNESASSTITASRSWRSIYPNGFGVNRHHSGMVLDFLGETVGQSRKAPHAQGELNRAADDFGE